MRAVRGRVLGGCLAAALMGAALAAPCSAAGLHLSVPGFPLTTPADLGTGNGFLALDEERVSDWGLIEPSGTLRRGHRGWPGFEGTRWRVSSRMQLLQDRGDGEDTLRVRRAKLQLRGDLSRYLRFWVQLEARSGFPIVEDLVLKWRSWDWLRLWLGQFKTPSSRSLLTSSGGMVFPDRPLAARVFSASDYERSATTSFTSLQGHGVGRTPGLQLWGEFGIPGRRSAVGRYYAHLTAGREMNRTTEGHGRTFRLELQPLGPMGFDAGVRKVRRRFRVSLEASWTQDRGNRSSDLDGDGLADPLRRDLLVLGVLARARRWALQVEHFDQDLAPSALPGRSSDGWYADLSFLLVDRTWELALRAGEVDPLRGVAGDLREERAISLTRYLDGHSRKWQVSFERREDAASPGGTEDRVFASFQIGL